MVVFSRRLSTVAGFEWLAPVGQLAWPWYVPLGTALTIVLGMLMSIVPGNQPEEVR